MTEKQILQDSISDHRKAIETAEAKLAELDKPKLRHGEIRHWHTASSIYGKLCGIVDLSGDRPAMLWEDDRNGSCRSEHDETMILRCSNVVSYPFDDIAERGKELEEFWVYGRDRRKVEAEFTESEIKFWLTIDADKYSHVKVNVSEAEEIHRKLGHVINYARKHSK